MKAILRKNGKDLLGSDGLIYIDGRISVMGAMNTVKKINENRLKNFPHKVADSFYFVGKNLNSISAIINL